MEVVEEVQASWTDCGSRSSDGSDAILIQDLNWKGGEGGECFSGYRVKYAKRFILLVPISLGQIGANEFVKERGK